MALNPKKYQHTPFVLWEKVGTGPSGESTFSAAQPLLCRWTQMMEELLLSDGRRVISNAQLMVPKLIVPGSVVYKGTAAEWKKLPTYPRIPTKLQGGFEVFKAEAVPDKQGRDLLFMAYL